MSEDERLSLDPVVAHAMLGTVAAAKGAIDTVLAHGLDGSTRDSLLLMATRRLDHLTQQLHALALGFDMAEATAP